jgi:hypothetical protein
MPYPIFLEVEKDMTVTFMTRIKNERADPVTLYSQLGQKIGNVQPGKEQTLETDNPEVLYAPFLSVIYKPEGKVDYILNPDFPKPEGKWLIEVLNQDGQEMERRIIGAREVCLLRGLPRVFALDADDPMALHSRIEIKHVMERQRSELFSDYSEFNLAVRDITTDRSDAELDALVAELEIV